MTAIFVNFDADVFHAKPLVHFGKFFDVRRVLSADGILFAAENRNGTILIDFCKVFLFVNFRKPVHKAFIEVVGHDVSALFVVAVLFDLIDVARKPGKVVSFFFERFVETAESDFVHKFAFRLFAFHLCDSV